MNRSATIAAIGGAVAAPGDRERQAEAVADFIRRAADYRWVGVYDVDDEIRIIGWSGAGPPAYPQFPRTEGLTGAAVADGVTVVANDVANDPRYLEAFGDTRAEIIVPVVVDGVVRGTIDVESSVPDVFADDDRTFLEQCAAAALPLWTSRDD
jgi:L-methionine (R)-S-oxide reductase